MSIQSQSLYAAAFSFLDRNFFFLISFTLNFHFDVGYPSHGFRRGNKLDEVGSNKKIDGR